MSENRSKSTAEYEAEIDEIYAECLAHFDKSKQKEVGATYLRHSSKNQDTIGDQLRENLRIAMQMGIFILRENIFFDAAVSGGKAIRVGLEGFKKLLDRGQVKVAIFFTQSRLFRNVPELYKFRDTYKKNVRLIFHRSGVDTATDKNGLMTGFNAVVDEAGRIANIASIRAAQLNLHRQGVVTTALCHGFVGVPIPNGPLTRRSRPWCMIAIDPVQAEVVREVFRRYDEGFSMPEIVHWLNYDSGHAPPTRSTSGNWTEGVISKMLSNRCYLGEFPNGDEE